jgi:ribosomal protein L17
MFENIRDDAQFKQIIETTKAKVAEMRKRVEELDVKIP